MNKNTTNKQNNTVTTNTTNVQPAGPKRIIGYTVTSTFIDSVRKMIQHRDGLNSIAVIINQDGEGDLTRILDMCDAVVLSGGADIAPMTMGMDLRSGMGYTKFDVDRDKRELFIIKYMQEHHKPLLGLCRGLQILGVSRGLNLWSTFSETRMYYINPCMKM